MFAPDSWRYSDKISQGNRDAQKLDACLKRTGHLPEHLEDVGEMVSESGPIYYEKCSDTRYVLWFGTTLGESVTFDSANHSWVSLNSGCSERR
jgi:hypothetical protein